MALQAHEEEGRRLRWPQSKQVAGARTHVSWRPHMATQGQHSLARKKSKEPFRWGGKAAGMRPLRAWAALLTKQAAICGGNLPISQALQSMDPTVSRWCSSTESPLPNAVVNKQWTVIAFLYLHQSSANFLGYDQNRISEKPSKLGNDSS